MKDSTTNVILRGTFRLFCVSAKLPEERKFTNRLQKLQMGKLFPAWKGHGLIKALLDTHFLPPARSSCRASSRQKAGLQFDGAQLNWHKNMHLRKREPWPVAQFSGRCPPKWEVAGEIPGQGTCGVHIQSPGRGTCGRQPIDVSLSLRCFSLSLSFSLCTPASFLSENQWICPRLRI